MNSSTRFKHGDTTLVISEAVLLNINLSCAKIMELNTLKGMKIAVFSVIRRTKRSKRTSSSGERERPYAPRWKEQNVPTTRIAAPITEYILMNRPKTRCSPSKSPSARYLAR